MHAIDGADNSDMLSCCPQVLALQHVYEPIMPVVSSLTALEALCLLGGGLMGDYEDIRELQLVSTLR